MSPAFQETLKGNELLMNSQEIRYYDTITMRHKDTKTFLHSHVDRYPMRYEDGRISSQGQQVTGYPHNDTNNDWQVIPTKAIPSTGRGRVVRHNDVVQLLHIKTDTYLMTHDVASSLMPTNQEFTTIDANDESRYNDTLFQIQINDAHEGEPWKSKSGHFKLIHIPTKVAMWTHPSPLPDWAFNQQEINGNKNSAEKSCTWYVDDIVADEYGTQSERITNVAPRPPKHMNFFRKFGELQLLMLQHNAGLTASHPYASGPINWPFLLSGISFWTEGESKKQIYMVGNVLGWWFCVMALSIFLGVLGADQLARRRGIVPIPDPVRNRLYNSTGFFLLAWAYHYFPFFLMNRQLFVHHYLPAHLASALVAGSVFNFILSETIHYPISIAGPSTRLRPRQKSDLGLKAALAAIGFALGLLIVFLFIAPLTYGTSSLDGYQVNRRRILSTWTLHFAGK
ncbi:dolichyl-phosphate-mannose-proteinmannosyltransferase [Rhizoctonia solani AG-1 IB]|nr:dolichyl-phosphate-mannose-proteinmannosyltransferase [Rhizoctonia solani AG-1 IB]